MRSKAELQLTVDATQVFDPYEPPVFAGFGQQIQPAKKRNPIIRALSKAQTQQLFMRHSFEVSQESHCWILLSHSLVNNQHDLIS